MTFFSHRANFSDFPFLFLEFPYLYYVKCPVSPFRPLLTRKTTISEKNSFMTPFFNLFVLSRASDNTTSQNIGGRMHGPFPHLKFFGDRPPVSPTCRSPPLVLWPVVRKRWDRCSL